MAWMTPSGARLPGLSPIPTKDWLIRDDAFAAQLAYRDQLIRSKKDDVYQALPECEAAAGELLEILLSELPKTQAYSLEENTLTRPDGARIDTASGPPLLVAGQLAQEDFALLSKSGDTYRLIGAVICFPANWRLSDKIGKSLGGLHDPVAAFDANMEQRTHRVFDHLRADTPLQRANFLIYTNPDLHQPQRAPKTIAAGMPRYVRVERQSLRRLPKTGAIVFAIHTYLVPAATLTPPQFAQLAALRPQLGER
ncbi:MAG: DUF3445 domain-containing protein [Hyphomonadaceae bacterium]